jgi:hypothetical protein
VYTFNEILHSKLYRKETKEVSAQTRITESQYKNMRVSEAIKTWKVC